MAARLARLDPARRAKVETMVSEGKGAFGPHWLVGDAKDRVLQLWTKEAARLNAQAILKSP